MSNLSLYVSAAALVFAGTCIYSNQVEPAPQAVELAHDAAAYSLIIERNGQEYVADYNLTLSDCGAAMASLQSIKPHAWPACERQPQGLIGKGA